MIITSFHDDDTNMTSLVFVSNYKVGYGVCLRDDDSGFSVPTSFRFFKTLEAAVAKAQEILAPLTTTAEDKRCQALKQAQAALRGLSFKDETITSALEAIHKALS